VDPNLLTSLSAQSQTAAAQRSNGPGVNSKSANRKDDAAPKDRKFSDELGGGDNDKTVQQGKSVAQPKKSSRAEGPGEADREQTSANAEGEKVKSADGKADGKEAKEATGERRTDGKPARSPSLEKVGALVRRGGDAAKSSDALALLSGNKSEIDPATIPQLVSENEFIGEALGEGIPEVMSKKYSVAEIIEKLDIPPRVIEQAKVQGLDLDEKVNAIDFFKALGIDPQKIVVELTRLRDSLGKEGLSSYMAKPTAFGENPPPYGMQPKNVELDDKNMRRKREQIPDLLAGVPSTPNTPVVNNPSLPTLNSVPERANVDRSSAAAPSTMGAAGPSIPTNEAFVAKEPALFSKDPALLLNKSAQKAESLGFLDPQATQKAAPDLSPRQMESATPDLQLPAFKSVMDPLIPFGNNSLGARDLSLFSNDVRPPETQSPLAPRFVSSELNPSERGIFVDASFGSSEGASLSGSSVIIQSLKSDPGFTRQPQLDSQSLVDQLSRTRLGLDSSIQLASFDQNKMPVVAKDGDVVPAEGLESFVNPRQFDVEGALQAGQNPLETASGAFDQPTVKNESPRIDLGARADGFVRGMESLGEKSSESLFGDQRKDDADAEPRDKMEVDAPVVGQNHFEKNVHHLAKSAEPGKPEPVNQDLANRIMDRISHMVREKRSEAIINVESPEMGQITLALQVENNQVNLRLVNGSERVKHILGADLAKLQDSLAAQNLRLADVNMGAGRDFSQSGDQGQHLRQQMHQQFSEQNLPRGRDAGDLVPRTARNSQVANIARGALGRVMSATINPGRIQVMA
jgi:hypothetical protein